MQTKVINIEDFRIEVSSKLKVKLARNFSCTTQFVRMALEYRSNSEKANDIRQGAKKLLQKQIDKIDSIKIED